MAGTRRSNTSTATTSDCNMNYSGYGFRNESNATNPFCEADADIARLKKDITLFFTCLNIVIAVGIVIGNLLVLTAYIKYAFVRTVQNTLLLIMSMSDLLTAPAIIMANVLTERYFDATRIMIPCLATAWLMALCFEAQIWMLLLVTVNRWISIRYPLRHHIMFNKKTVVISTTAVLAVMVATNTGCSLNNIWTPGTKCYPFRVVNPLCYKILVYPFILLPLVVMPVLYIVLTRYALLQKRRMKGKSMKGSPESRARSKETKTLKTIGIILAILYVSWVPTFLLSFGWDGGPNTYSMVFAKKSLRNLATSCLYLGSLFNPVVYHRCSASFRRAFLTMFNKGTAGDKTSRGSTRTTSAGHTNSFRGPTKSQNVQPTSIEMISTGI